MFGIDLSNHQNGIDLSKKNFSFAIVKATEGKSFVDPSFKSHVNKLNNLDKLIGCYHFARPDRQNTKESMSKSADHFIKTVESVGLLGKAILVLDWEYNPIDRTDLMEVWLDRVYECTGITPFLYANSSFIINKRKIIKNLGVPLWVAKWPDMKVMRDWPDVVYIERYNPFATGWDIWQFSSTGTWPYFNGRVDLNYTKMTEKQWKNFAFGNAKENEDLSEDMVWAIEHGLIKGFPDGMYRPDEPLTRNQLSTVIRRLYDMMNK